MIRRLINLAFIAIALAALNAVVPALQDHIDKATAAIQHITQGARS